jgi:hypothetical protein
MLSVIMLNRYADCCYALGLSHHGPT